jgi:hypothetical protein
VIIESNNGKVPRRCGRSFIIDDIRPGVIKIDRSSIDEFISLNEQLDYEFLHRDRAMHNCDTSSVGYDSEDVYGSSRKPRFRDKVTFLIRN